ncbi:unnamed protein product (macronuclear) [Paramecium tetraurelia]|uniref:Ubiquitin-like domain-containing protein n=1 Tax=Paramecium tetraurelia TaxID=5888 RepID=A0C9V1_PARTE|nr:uncharacterized protein GSPATT00006875001 [Paramecium tetraurelia]CAK67568.1 unnamed protein product [Paramecium tetraurelia]|eukprot:XP_001434965.1 hypothetical protein (macronuclear) [Paramecium tetraurelia strain d4-2]
MGSCCSHSENRESNHHGGQEQQRMPRAIGRQQQNGNAIQDVNEQYKIYFDILEQQVSGKGLKRTQAYKSHIDIGQIEKLRNVFWETRVEGKQEIWQILRSIINEDEETARLLVQEAELKPIKDSLQHVYDKLGQKYDVPIFCINDPIEYSNEKFEDRGLIQNYGNDSVKLTIRSVNLNGKDIVVECKQNQSVVDLKEIISVELQKGHQIQLESMKLFYRGKEMQDNYQVGRYNLNKEAIVIAYLKILQKG